MHITADFAFLPVSLRVITPRRGLTPFSVYLNFSLFFLVSISISKLDYKRLMHVMFFYSFFLLFLSVLSVCFFLEWQVD